MLQDAPTDGLLASVSTRIEPRQYWEHVPTMRDTIQR